MFQNMINKSEQFWINMYESCWGNSINYKVLIENIFWLVDMENISASEIIYWLAENANTGAHVHCSANQKLVMKSKKSVIP